ncbi:LacI family DNA-binding transcriptional regulator [Stutzerimonas stutzeri]|jgi:LacI family transcriptional regulator, gluconate utilization system Gnt-I transcriptional repressor|uniref:LacI family DNA-binding transcriptional regulator n=1 Tax=Stutzerimonas stutzeri TaxID=316 RepID=A0AA42PCH9_STUST|nr:MULTISPECIES: LacI family DNA-binding transcriptional regulator [Stutzerimonas]HAG17470.1 LacI family DNA-binding transcriptional regulator [Pseudomonas sp.]MDH0213928.1 LacI family DNA-binding transcriptional regulator [Stutzerimonas stutzeri]MDH0259931.1 LacI family DNA-binding transcriptional regulator [Stutzerimonas stutzeri]MDH0504282.1 LacI family DNA-binding transcriptional regulator [Stutzerimonas stutzeri]MDH1236584.1 LacI family DNA-binding transcriptional regulator [Stutzerimonas
MTTRRRRSAERVTLSDVARNAGCSLMSASRALSQPELVSDALRERVEQAVKALGYVPHPAARSLASSRSNLVAVIIPSLSNAVFVDTVEAIQRVLMPAGYEMMIGVSHYRPEEDERLLRAYLAHQPAGLLLTGFERSEAARAVLASYTAPRVTLMELSDQADNYCVGFSQLQAGAAMTRTLLERGYRHVAFAAAQLDPRTLQRAEGYRQAMREAGRYEPTLELLTPQLSSIGLGAELLDRLLAQHPQIDAVFFNNDDLALGALFRAHQLGLEVPGRLAIAGFNDLPAAAWMHPALSTVRTRRGEIGELAAQMLLSLMRGQQPAERCIDVGFEVVMRDSA